MARLKRGTDGFFSTTITVGRDAAGKRLRKRIRSKTVQGLRDKESAFRAELTKGPVTLGKKPTLTEFLNVWLADVVKQRNRARTYDRYGMDVRNHLIPKLGTIRIDKLATADVQRMLNDIFKTGRVFKKEEKSEGKQTSLAPRTVRNVHATLRQALNTAIKWNLISRNVAEGAELPKAEKPNLKALSPDQARKLLEEVQGTRLEALFWVALLLGLRQGEILGLHWSDIDVEERTIRINGAIQRIKQPQGPSKLMYVAVKTLAGQRLLPLPDILVEALKKHRTLQDEERHVEGWIEQDLVFASEIGSPIGAQNLVARVFKPALVAAELPDIPFHALRHSCATLLLSLGVDVNTVSAILGHTSAALTLSVYGKALPEMTRSAVDNLSDLLKSDRVLELRPKVKQPKS